MAAPPKQAIDTSAADGGLKQILDQERVHEDFQAALVELEVDCLSDFVKLTTEAKEREDLKDMADAVESCTDKVTQLSRIRNAWEIAFHTHKLSLPSSSQVVGEPSVPIDDTLPATVTLQLKADWTKRYGEGAFEPHMHLVPSDQLLARLYREFQKGTPTIIPVEKSKSAFVAGQPRTEESVPVGRNVSLHLNESRDPQVRSIVDYYWCLRILAYAVARTGNYQVKDPNDGTKMILYAPLSTNLDYADEALRKALTHNQDQQKATGWRRERDLLTRGIMVAHIRSGMPQGLALTQALLDTKLDWQTGGKGAGKQNAWAQVGDPPTKRFRSAESDNDWGAHQQRQERAPPKKKGEGKGKAKDDDICRAFNEPRGCTKKEADCPTHRRHVCNVRTNGRVCGKGNHSAKTHDPTKTKGR